MARVRALVDLLDELRGFGQPDAAAVADVDRRWRSLSTSERDEVLRLLGQWPRGDLVHLREVLLS